MSEYCDYYAVRVPDPAALAPALAEAGIPAIVFDDLVDAALPRPAWVALALFGEDEAALCRFGPAVAVVVGEDTWDAADWQLTILPGGPTLTFYEGEFWYEYGGEQRAPDHFRPVPPRALTAEDAARLMELFGVPWDHLRPTLRPGGFADFVDATGMAAFDMLDQYQFKPPPPGGPAAISARTLAD